MSRFFHLSVFLFLSLLVSEHSAISLQQILLLWKGTGFGFEHYPEGKAQAIKIYLLDLWLRNIQDWADNVPAARGIRRVILGYA